MSDKKSIHGVDPLALLQAEGEQYKALVDEANKRVVLNILKSYAGYFDLFSEPLQNALDSVALKSREKVGYTGRIWIQINMQERFVRIVDNGSGMSNDQFRFCLCPNISFKRGSGQRGNKGVGATFLAYGFSVLELHSRDRDGQILAARIRQGRAWANDNSGAIPRPTLEEIDFSIPELGANESGVAAKIVLGGAAGEKPKNLNWLGASTADQWFDVLRIKTPLGGVYLSAPQISPQIKLSVIALDGSETTVESNRAEYYYPHELPVANKVQDLGSIHKALQNIEGDYSTRSARLPAEFKRLDCIYEVWNKDALISDASPFADLVKDANLELVERHSVSVYGAFLCSAKLWGKFVGDHLKLRSTAKIIHGGLQLACDQMVQGDLFVIPLTSAIGYQANAHIIVHFSDGNPDLGRKVFQPELKSLADQLAVRAVTIFKKYLNLLRSEAAAKGVPSKALYEWKKSQESFRDAHGLSLESNGKSLRMVSCPQQEQDVVALFHELLGLGVLSGYKVLATSSHERYDSLFVTELSEDHDAYSLARPLGVGQSALFAEESEPKVLEYKYHFEDLVGDFERETKAPNEIDLAVAWEADKADFGHVYLRSLLVGDDGADRRYFGATHHAFIDGHPNEMFEVIVLKDLLAYMQDPVSEAARQKALYRQ